MAEDDSKSKFDLKGALTSGLTNFISTGNLFSGALGALGGLFGGNSAKSAAQQTNEMNYKIWQEQKQHNLDMYNLQKDDSIEFWNMQNEYNSPTAQRERWEAAGFSPWTLANSGNAGNATSSPSLPGMNGTNAPTMQQPDSIAFKSPLSIGLETTLQSALALSQVDNTVADTKNKGITSNILGLDFKIKGEDLFAKQQYNKYLPELSFLNYENALIENRIKRDTRDDIIAISHAQRTLSELSVEEQTIASQYFTQSAWLRINTEAQMLANAVVNGRLTARQATSLMIRDGLAIAETNQGIKESNQRIRESESRVKLNDQEYNLNRPDEIVANTTTETYEFNKQNKQALRTLVAKTFQVNLNRALASELESGFTKEYNRKAYYIPNKFDIHMGNIMNGLRSFIPFVPSDTHISTQKFSNTYNYGENKRYYFNQ